MSHWATPLAGTRTCQEGPQLGVPSHASLPEASEGRWKGRAHLLKPADLLLELTFPCTAVIFLQAQAAAAAPSLLHLKSEELQMFELLAEVLDQL